MSRSLRPLAPSSRRSRAGFRLLLPVLAALAGLVLLAGCGGGDKSGAEADAVLLAKVGEVPITSQTYRLRLALTAAEDLPRGEDGQLLDTSTPAGRRAFLDHLVDNQVLAQTAEALGYGAGQDIAHARSSLTAYEAGMALWRDEINEPAGFISTEQFDAYYEKMGSTRTGRILVTDFLENAQAARTMALAGTPWEDVVARYHTGQEDPMGRYVLEIPFGRYKVEVEDAVYGVGIGEVTEPVQTSYGYLIVQVESEKAGRRPPVEKARASILDHIRRRNIRRLQAKMRETVHRNYDFVIESAALQTVYDGLPRTVADQRSLTGEQLPPLNVSTVAMESPFYHYKTPEGIERVYTVGDFKVKFDRMTGSQRPTREGLIAGLRAMVAAEVEKALFTFEADQRGYPQDPGVQIRVEAKIEEMLIKKLKDEALDIDRRVTAAQLDSFWTLHSAEFELPETRNGRLVVCLVEEFANEAREAALKGVDWDQIVARYDSDAVNRERQGRLLGVRADGEGALRDLLFAMEPGQVSEVFELDEGRFAVARLDEVRPPSAPDKVASAEAAGVRIRRDRERTQLDRLMAGWRRDIVIELHEENLADLPSWDEIHETPVPDNVVPRYIPRP
ncbi:peptidyl-prolyl cis-trans isomerase [bacterium]|nr:peptidyl-prolyl cis-trans isomerase [bacterium]